MSKILLIISVLLPFLSVSQSPVECYGLLSTTKQFLVDGDTAKAVQHFKSIPLQCNQQIGSSHHYKFAKILLSESPLEAEIEIQKAIDKGLLEWNTNNDELLKMLNEIKDNYGNEMLLCAMNSHREQIKKQSKETKNANRILHTLVMNDQMFRRDTTYRDAKKYYSKLRTGQLKERAANHDTLLELIQEFRFKDSLNLLEAIHIFLEHENMTTDNLATFKRHTTLINHMSSYEFEINIDSLLVSRIYKGKLSPKTYAWYEGYKTSNYRLPSEYYYVEVPEDLMENLIQVEKVNIKRRMIGLPELPATVWTHGSN